ncbi:MAG: type II secretion system protein [Lachnospiraceae bacterium]|nr:type II secretion system protein [Lachnospiraceae bacterium]
MKKMNNKGFSLVELIIVIAIMAILAGAIAPALIRYIDKSRKSNDVSSCKAIKTAVETALGNESIYEYLTYNGSGTGVTTIKVICNQNTSSAGTTAIQISGCTAPADADANIATTAATEIGTNIGEKTPKIKYKKASGTSGVTPGAFYAFVTTKGTVYVVIGDKDTAPSYTVDATTKAVTFTTGYVICPDICADYQ